MSSRKWRPFCVKLSTCCALQTLWLRRNEMSDIHDLAFNGLSRLRKLDVSVNKLIQAPSLSCIGSSLEELNLSWNKIGHINGSYFDSCKNIKLVFLDKNQLVEIPNIRSIAKTVSLLSLGGNSISSGISMYGIQFPRLQTLQLSYNQITSFCLPPKYFAPSLREIYLQSNNLSSISFSHADASDRIDVYISLELNPWHCNESLGWTEKCLHGKRYKMLSMGWLTVNRMICASPANVTGLSPNEAGMILFLCVLPPNLVKSRNRKIGCYIDRIALKFGRVFGRAAAEVPAKFQSDWKSLNPNRAASRLREILW